MKVQPNSASMPATGIQAPATPRIYTTAQAKALSNDLRREVRTLTQTKSDYTSVIKRIGDVWNKAERGEIRLPKNMTAFDVINPAVVGLLQTGVAVRIYNDTGTAEWQALDRFVARGLNKQGKPDWNFILEGW